MPDSFRTTPTRVLLGRVAAARAAGDWTTARAEWEACVVRARERVVVVVDRYVARGWIRPSDAEDTVQDALLRAMRRLVETLDSLDEGAFYAGVATCAGFQCQDAARRQMKHEMKEKSLDAASWGEDGEARGRYEGAFGRAASEAWEREQAALDATSDLDALCARLRDERARKIFMLKRLGQEDPRIAEELGISVANVHTIRSRALREMKGMIDR